MVITGGSETVTLPTVIDLARLTEALEAPAIVMMAIPLLSWARPSATRPA